MVKLKQQKDSLDLQQLNGGSGHKTSATCVDVLSKEQVPQRWAVSPEAKQESVEVRTNAILEALKARSSEAVQKASPSSPQRIESEITPLQALQADLRERDSALRQRDKSPARYEQRFGSCGQGARDRLRGGVPSVLPPRNDEMNPTSAALTAAYTRASSRVHTKDEYGKDAHKGQSESDHWTDSIAQWSHPEDHTETAERGRQQIIAERVTQRRLRAQREFAASDNQEGANEDHLMFSYKKTPAEAAEPNYGCITSKLPAENRLQHKRWQVICAFHVERLLMCPCVQVASLCGSGSTRVASRVGSKVSMSSLSSLMSSGGPGL